MKSDHLSILLAILLAAGVVLSGALFFVGPDRVEEQTIELFREQQALLAEQGAMRLSETFRNIQVRVDEAAERLHEEPRGQLEARLRRIGHPNDSQIGLAFVVASEKGEVLAIDPRVGPERAERLTEGTVSIPDKPSKAKVDLCFTCLMETGTVSIYSKLGDGRTLLANINLDNLVRDVFRQITAGRIVNAYLTDEDGTVLLEERMVGLGDGRRVVAGAANLSPMNWKIIVETPRSVIAAEIEGTVRSLLYVSMGVLATLLLALGVFAYLKRREYAEKLRRIQSLAQTEKLATVGMLGSSISHEIRNIISAVQMNLELARRKPQEETGAYLDKASEATVRLEDLAENITGYVRDGEDEAEQFGLRDTVDDALDLVGTKVEDAMLRLDMPTNPTIRGKKGAVTQVIVNLILNAYQAAPDRPRATITIGIREQDEAGIIEVADNGSGIDPEILDEMFEPFFSTKEDSAEGGTGLGLWLCSEIVEQHHGTIDAQNREQGGALFRVQFPLADHAPPASESSETTDVDDGGDEGSGGTEAHNTGQDDDARTG